MRRLLAVTLLVVAAPLLQQPTAAAATADCAEVFYPSLTWAGCSARNAAVSTQNAAAHLDLAPGIAAETLAYQRARAAAIAADPERQPNPNTCTAAVVCAVDPRTSGWTERGGIVEPVLYTSRSGATMSGHIWATWEGPAKRPGALYINGSILGYEQTYWYLAQTLAKAGFVVMTFDAQGEGNSDQFGEAPDQLEDAFAGTPFLGPLGPTGTTGDFLGGNGLPFYDGGQDALDFFLSTPERPFVPRKSRSTGTSHAAKQARRVEAGHNAAYNPLWRLLDRSRVGLSGHSYGAEATSWLTQSDPRVDAGVAHDNLCVPVSPSPDELEAITRPNPDVNYLPGMWGLPTDCFGAPNGPAPAITKPVLGITTDYFTGITPYPLPPHPLGKARASQKYSAAGVDTGAIVIRGGTHIDFTDTPLIVPATLRGIDLIAWYTTAWMLKYVAHDPAGERMLLSHRWRQDPAAGAVDPAGDANMLSWHYRSRLDITRDNGTAYRCENLRRACAGMVPKSQDGWAGEYSFVGASS
ncbi:hypothetical protein [Nocardioides speluncae]|uniref:hypothetical protein n=1 Tax=Nocardioides speluncae TaxID=2670337 RepID=UPI000D693192|nr:hypothetical protein [Nocardioides speluncae]